MEEEQEGEQLGGQENSPGEGGERLEIDDSWKNFQSSCN